MKIHPGFVFLALWLVHSLTERAVAEDTHWLFVGTYSGGKSKGIYRCTFDAASGKLGAPELAAEDRDPAFLAIHPSRKFLYSANEVADVGPKKYGSVTAYSLDSVSGKLTKLNMQPAGGAGPCHINVDKTGKVVLVANYGSGSTCAIPLQSDGRLAETSTAIQHQGSSIDKSRQEGPHAHSINVDPSNRFAYTADLGLDKILIYKLDAEKGTITPNDPPAATVEAGSGPRHFCFHPNGKFAYVINEMKSTVTAFDFDAKTGDLTRLQTITTLPRGFEGNTSTAEVVAHPNGKLLFGSNRGHNSIAIFRVDPKTGMLIIAGHQGKNVSVPRNFNLDPTGRWLLVGNQDQHSIAVFRVDEKKAELIPTGDPIAVPSPVCLRFVAK